MIPYKDLIVGRADRDAVTLRNSRWVFIATRSGFTVPWSCILRRRNFPADPIRVQFDHDGDVSAYPVKALADLKKDLLLQGESEFLDQAIEFLNTQLQ